MCFCRKIIEIYLLLWKFVFLKEYFEKKNTGVLYYLKCFTYCKFDDICRYIKDCTGIVHVIK